MSRTDTWMPFYVADYLGDTGHLRMGAHGAYVMMIFHYWRTGPLPDDDASLAAIARATDKEWKAVSGQVRAFFVLVDGRLHHKRIDAERQKAAAISAKRAAAGAAGAQQTNGKWRGNQAANAAANAEDLPQPGRTQLPIQPQEPEEDRSLRSLTAREPAGFLEWWAEYPRKDAKGAARKAYAAALRRTSAAALLRALAAYPWNPDPRFIPHPATWLNDGRWESAHEAPELPIGEPDRKGRFEALVEQYGRKL